ncbi:MAG: hypothetical protein ACK58N_11525 [Synechocystis sp.]|jgi:hypothetical protein
MVIANLNYLDTVSQESEIVGGTAIAVAGAGAIAAGPIFAATGTSTNTVALDFGFFGPKFAASRSASVSVAE